MILTINMNRLSRAEERRSTCLGANELGCGGAGKYQCSVKEVITDYTRTGLSSERSLVLTAAAEGTSPAQTVSKLHV